jgi:hypothetical protein
LYIDTVNPRMPHSLWPETFDESNGPIVMPPKDLPEKGIPPDSTQPEEKPEDEVEEAGEESFPASDAPPWTGTAAD